MKDELKRREDENRKAEESRKVEEARQRNEQVKKQEENRKRIEQEKQKREENQRMIEEQKQKDIINAEEDLKKQNAKACVMDQVAKHLLKTGIVESTEIHDNGPSMGDKSPGKDQGFKAPTSIMAKSEISEVNEMESEKKQPESDRKLEMVSVK